MDWLVAKKYVIPLGIVVLSLALGWVFQKLISVILNRAARKTQNKWDDILVQSLRGVVIVWFLLAGVEIALKTVVIPPGVARPLNKALAVLIIFSIVLFLVRLARGLVNLYFDRQTAVPTSIIRSIASGFIYIIGFLMILDFLGVSITPILTALGVGALAVALALQDTLANLFAGIHILLTKQVRQGDYIRLDNDNRDEGVVTDITWRNLTIRTLSNSLVIVPNNKLASSIVTNFHLPDAEVAVLVEARVGYDSDLKRVEKIIGEVAAAVMQDTPGGVPGFQPFVRYHTLGDSGINFTVIMRGSQYIDQFLVKHEFLKRLHERFQAEGIKIPLPARRVYLEGEKDGAAPRTEKDTR
jgi:small-conductance mechanosensitive channel